VLDGQTQRNSTQRTKMKKLNISINLLQLQGSVRATVKGEDCVILRLEKSRAKPHQNGKVYLNLEAVANKNGVDDYGNSHFIVEPSTKEERESGAAKLPIIGNGKEWSHKIRFGASRDDAGSAARLSSETGAKASADYSSRAGVFASESAPTGCVRGVRRWLSRCRLWSPAARAASEN